jgi:hypothetical protein
MNATWTCNGYKVVLSRGVVVESNHPAFAVGQKVTTQRMVDGGWCKAKVAAQTYAKGLKNGRNYY